QPDSPPRGMPSPQLINEWDQGIKRMESIAYRAGKGALGYYDNGERDSKKDKGNTSSGSGSGGGSSLPEVDVDAKSFMDDVLGSFAGGGGEEGERKSVTAAVSYPLTAMSGTSQQQPQQRQQHEEIQPNQKLCEPSAFIRVSQTVRDYTQQLQQDSVILNPIPKPVIPPTPTVEEIRKSLQESIKSLEQPTQEPDTSAQQTQPVKKQTLQELMQQEQEEEDAAQKEKQRIQQEAEYERKRLERERRDRELQELEAAAMEAKSGSRNSIMSRRRSRDIEDVGYLFPFINSNFFLKDAAEECRREKEKAKLAGLRAREEEAKKLNNNGRGSSSRLSQPIASSPPSESSRKSDKKSEDAEMKILNDLEADPMMQKYMAIVKEKREKEQAKPGFAETQDEKVNKILSALENTSLISSDESGKVISGETIDDISAPSTSTDVLDDPW
ncbi:UNVERIFIED_CONTAM: hypothetical protein HDU68_004850, partial [Siphonaria sp. JEL0065]